MMPRTRKLAGVIPLSDGWDFSSFVGRRDEYADEPQFLEAIRFGYSHERQELTRVRSLYVRVCICTEKYVDGTDWHIEEYEEPGPGRFAVWMTELRGVPVLEAAP